MKQFFILIAASLMLSACKTLHSGSENDIDIFYICSTEVMHAYDDNGTEIFNSRLVPEDTLALNAELKFVGQNYAQGYRYFAPYYEQFTFSAISLPSDSFALAYNHAKADITRRFTEYMTTQNNGRNYVIVGFSQGAMLALDLLKEMPEEYFSRCRAVYMMGYRISAEDAAHKRITPAKSATKGNVVSFNSVMHPSAIWPFVAKDAATCINPINWRTDAKPATLIFDGDTASVSVDKKTQQLIVSGLDEQKFKFPISETGNLHHWDLLFYAPQIHENISRRNARR